MVALPPGSPAGAAEADRMMDGWGMTLGGWVWMVAWIAALTVMVWLIVHRSDDRPRDDAMAILRARFARGELSQQEYEQARDTLLADQGEFQR
jgi:putative membrane protein